MNILAISYYNIGPFYEKLISINFKKGKYLIKAPIGTGKSFLFFDGPIFGIYKQNSRPLLNRKAKNGFIKILIQQQEEYFLIIREIKPTKTGGESVSSRFYKIEESSIIKFLEKFDEIFLTNIDIQKELIQIGNVEEILFKSETETQNNIEDLLTKKEVLLNTNLLMQESDNIFELTPTERINVFKNIFGLIGIDDAKEIIQEKRKELQINLKIKSDSSQFDEKLKTNLNKIKLNKEQILDYNKKNLDNEILLLLEELFKNQLFEDLNLIIEKINIKDFDINNINFVQTNSILKKIDDIKSSYNNTLGKLQAFENNIKTIDENINQKDIESNKIKQEIEKIELNLSELNENKLNELKELKTDLIKKESEILKTVDFNTPKNYGFECENILDIYNIIENLKKDGSTFKDKIENHNHRMENILKEKEFFNASLLELELKPGTSSFQQYQNNISNIKENNNIQIKNLQIHIKEINTKIQNHIKEKEILEDQLKSIDEMILSQANYKCGEINKNCPFIKQINKEVFDKFELNKSQIKLNIDQINKNIEIINKENNIENFEQKINDFKIINEEIEKNPEKYQQEFLADIQQKRNKIINDINGKKFDLQIEQLKKDKIIYENELNNIKNFFNAYKWKEFKELYNEIINIQNQQKELDLKINDFEKKLNQLNLLKENLNQHKNILQTKIQQIIELNTEKEKIIGQITLKKNLLENYNITLIQQIQQNIENIDTSAKNIQLLVEEYKKQMLNLKIIQQDEKIYADLYQIFSKELMLIVLQEFLPNISEIINNLLSGIVNFSIKFEIIKKSSDKIELDIQIIDEKGIRNVKSLSGGQKTILRLVWILAISTMLKLDFVFLDETINNLDHDTISKVGELITNFTKINDIKFYIVTHSLQIQQMNIWDHILNINNI